MPKEIKAPTGAMGGEDMDQAYQGAEGTSAEEAAESPEQEREEEGDGTETVMEKSVFPPEVKEGDTCTFKVTKDYGKEFGLKYLSSSAGGREEQAGDYSSEKDNAEIDSLDTEKY